MSLNLMLLEERIVLDGAAVATVDEVVDNQEQPILLPENDAASDTDAKAAAVTDESADTVAEVQSDVPDTDRTISQTETESTIDSIEPSPAQQKLRLIQISRNPQNRPQRVIRV